MAFSRGLRAGAVILPVCFNAIISVAFRALELGYFSFLLKKYLNNFYKEVFLIFQIVKLSEIM